MNHELCIDDKVKEFIKKHLKDDVNKLALSKFPEGIDRDFVIRQIHARQVLSKKLPSWAENDELIFPKKLSLEQCSSELAAKYKTILSSTNLHESSRKEISANSCNLVDEDLVDEEKSTKLHEIARKEFSENSCNLADENLVDEEKSTNLHEIARKEFSANSCNLVDEDLVDEEKSTNLHEIARKEFSANSCNLVDEDLVDEEKSTNLHETTRKEFSADSCNLVDKKRILVDLTGGMGVDTAFLSDNFDKTYYVEMQEELCEIAKHNFKILNKNIEVVNDNAEHFLTICDQVDCIYLDPARRDEYGRKMVSLHDCSPDVVELHDILLKKAKRVLIKVSPMLDIEMVKKELKDITEMHVVAVRNECKEVLIGIQEFRNSGIQEIETQSLKDTNIGSESLRLCDSATSIKISSTDLRENWNITFTEDEELEAQWTLADAVGKYLYEPGAACMKAGCFKLLSQRYGLDKLHRNSHLYTSDELVPDFPGRIFEVVNVVPFDKKTKKNIWTLSFEDTRAQRHKDAKNDSESLRLCDSATLKKASVATRNFPLSAEELKKNLGLQDGSEFYIFGTTMKGEKKMVILTKKI